MLNRDLDLLIKNFQEDIPVRVGDLARNVGLEVYMQYLTGGVSGILLKDKDLGGLSAYSIIVNGNDPKVRQRFTIAHQIGHFLLHPDSIGNELQDDSFYRSHLPKEKEDEANSFALTLLLPSSHLHKVTNEGTTDTTEIARTFDVSETAVANRLKLVT